MHPGDGMHMMGMHVGHLGHQAQAVLHGAGGQGGLEPEALPLGALGLQALQHPELIGAGLPPSSMPGAMVHPAGGEAGSFQSEADTIDALQQAILATINAGTGSGVPDLFAALQTLGEEQMPLGVPGGAGGLAPGSLAPLQQQQQHYLQHHHPQQQQQQLGHHAHASGLANGGHALGQHHLMPGADADGALGLAAAQAGLGLGLGVAGPGDLEAMAATLHSRKGRRRQSDIEEEELNPTLATAREKNRLAQRRFREKQRATIAEQRERLDAMARQLEDYKREVQLLREENSILRAKLEGRAALHQHMLAGAPV